MNRTDDLPTLSEVASEFFRVPLANLPTGKRDLEQALVAEAIRLALADREPDDRGWRTRHILSLRSWVTRKLRALIPILDAPSDNEDTFVEVLREGVGGNLVFLGDVTELAGGYYAPSPTRVVPIAAGTCLLVSGLPSAVLAKHGLQLNVKGISRIAQEGAESINSRLGLQVQERDSYLGTMGREGFSEESILAFIQRQRRRRWTEADVSDCYQGNRGAYGFEFSEHYASVSSPVGYASLWEAATNVRPGEYWLRIKNHGKDEMIWIPNQLKKHVCLLLDKWGNKPRRVVISEADTGALLKAQFPPPGSQIRWIHAVGGQWLGSESPWIRWNVPRHSLDSLVHVFGMLPVTVETGERR